GPTGTGKTHLIRALVHEATRRSPQLIVTLLHASDLEGLAAAWETSNEAREALLAAKQSDLFLVEDLHQLRSGREPSGNSTTELLVQIFDYLYARQGQLVFTALVGPRELVHLPRRLVSRLGCGLVVGLRPMPMSSRLALLQHKAQRRQLAVSPDVLAWVAEHLGGGRQLEGALAQLETLARVHERPLDVPTV